MNKQVGQKGFTIVELLIASSVFSVVLLICAAGLIQIGKTYYKGITASQTQETARSIMEEISKTVQFNGGNISGIMNVDSDGVPSQNPTSPSYFCVGSRRFAFVLNRQMVPEGSTDDDVSKHVLVTDNRSCDGPEQLLNQSELLADSKELMSPNMRLTKFEVRDNGNGLYKITIRVVNGHRDVLVAGADGKPALPGECVPSTAGGQFCAVSELSTTVQKRVK